MSFFARLLGKPARAKTGRSTVGIGGHGLLLAPRCPCRIAPGTSPAAAAPAPVEGEPHVFLCGEEGPRIALDSASGMLSLDEVLLRVDVGLDASPWMLLGPGFMIEHPAQFTAYSAGPEDADPCFELHPGAALDSDEMNRFWFAAGPAADIQIAGPAGAPLLEGASPGETGSVRTWQMAYQRGGEEWVQRQYALPLSPTMAVMMSAQSPRRSWAPMEIGAELVAATFGSLAE